MQTSDWQIQYDYAINVLGQDIQQATFTANRICILMGAPLPERPKVERPKITYKKDKCSYCGLPYPPHYYGYVGHDMEWPAGVTA